MRGVSSSSMPTALSVSSAATTEGLCLRTAHQGAGLIFHITRCWICSLGGSLSFSICVSLSLSLSPPRPRSLSILERWPQVSRWSGEERLWRDAAEVQSSVQGSDCVIAQAWCLSGPLTLLWSSLAFLCSECPICLGFAHLHRHLNQPVNCYRMTL